MATLATLILLSYAKLVEICFKSLSVDALEYPDGSIEMLWLPDATVNCEAHSFIQLHYSPGWSVMKILVR